MEETLVFFEVGWMIDTYPKSRSSSVRSGPLCMKRWDK